jgi:hypothetical protein
VIPKAFGVTLTSTVAKPSFREARPFQAPVRHLWSKLREIVNAKPLLDACHLIVFLELFVVMLDKTANDSRRLSQRIGREILLRIETAQDFTINQKHTFQHAVLAHQIFRRTNLDFLFLALVLWRRATQHSHTGQGCAAENDAASKKNSAIRALLVSLSVLHLP